GGDDEGARAKDARDAGVRDEIDVAMTIARLDVLEARLRREWAERLREQPEARRADRELALLGGHRCARGLDDVAEIDLLFEARVERPEPGLLAVELKLARAIAEAHEGDASERSEEQHATGDAESDRLNLRGVVAAVFALHRLEPRAHCREL